MNLQGHCCFPKSQPKITEIFDLSSNRLPGQKSVIFGWDFGRNDDLIYSF